MGESLDKIVKEKNVLKNISDEIISHGFKWGISVVALANGMTHQYLEHPEIAYFSYGVAALFGVIGYGLFKKSYVSEHEKDCCSENFFERTEFHDYFNRD